MFIYIYIYVKHVCISLTALESRYSIVTKTLQSAIEAIRCYKDMYPDLNSRNASDVVLVSLNSISPETSPKPYPIICTDPTYGWNSGKK